MADSNESSDQIPEVSESGDKLTIINGSKIYRVSKKFICSSIPYFESMFCSDLLEAQENKVELDLDEHSFDCVLNWIHSDSVQIEMESVITLLDVADYLLLNDLSEDCYSYFHAYFTIEHLPVVIPQVTKTSKLINSGALNTFICHHFLKIAKTSIFLNYPVETLEYICKLDLMISSEYQVLEAINDWIKFKAGLRKEYRLQLLRCIRWRYAGTDISSKILDVPYIATIQDVDEILCSPSSSKLECTSNRTKQCLLISIQRINDMCLNIRVLQSQFWLPIGYFNLDDSMSLEFVHGENISDVLYDCGTKGVRIDWEGKKFCWLNLESDESYYQQINKLIVSSQTKSSTILYLDDKCFGNADDPLIDLFHLRSSATSRRLPTVSSASHSRAFVDPWDDWSDCGCSSYPSRVTRRKLPLVLLNDSENEDVPTSVPSENDEKLLLESDGEFIVVGKTKDNKFYTLFPVRHPEWFKMENYVNYDQRSFIATILGSNIFILTKKLKFIQFDYKTQTFKQTVPFKGNQLKFMDLIITSLLDNDYKIVLIHKSSGKIHYFNIDSQTWTETNISNRKPNQTNSKDCIMASTSVFLPLDKIKPYFFRKSSSLD
ncbi:uncharacterized protein LOC107361459 [Tetranychus urticae]|uniref:uncharacterized protein LOC107361459 n=1 Tax=Tetranychus urticae TaxID=32264 RepID=UPI00077BE1B5|nr:uncharacterized protein LOC107361459 [Tetranychus urticae]XP_025016373.1 uncharacterized protein LOC107361459 [Tetranychus urticae]